MPDTLDFEEPIAALLKEIDTLTALPATDARNREIEALQRRIQSVRAELYRSLTPWQRVQVARHPNRPGLEFFTQRLFSGFTEIHGDRRYADDHAIMTGFADYKSQPVLLVGHVKGAGGDTKEKIFRNFGYARPEGYRKALRAMRLGEKFSRPVIVFVDTPAAYPGIESEERGVAEAIAVNLREMMLLDTPIVVIVSGEGGSGGALGIAVGDRVLMQEFAIYSVIPPEGCAAILWRDAARKVEAADALKLTAPDLLREGIIDAIVPEPAGGAHTDPEAAARGRRADAHTRGGDRSRAASPARCAVPEIQAHGPPQRRLRGWGVSVTATEGHSRHRGAMNCRRFPDAPATSGAPRTEGSAWLS
jgi:acetyl-CoA carboxylase carboxyl transferase subunit alpha